MEEYGVSGAYQTLRKHLDSLGYQQAFSLDALPLVEKLLADLIKTTESLKYFKTVAQDNIEACRRLESLVDPYKCDNSRLIRECNQLHQELIEAKEARQKDLMASKKKIYKLDCECVDLRSESSRHLNRIKQLELESSKKSKKILELQGKCLKPVISNVGLSSVKRPSHPLRRAQLESAPIPKTVGTDSSCDQASSEKTARNFNMLKMADDSINFLNHEISKLKGELSFQKDTIHMLQSQLAAKEKEITRLKTTLETERPYSAIFKDYACKRTEDSNGIGQEKVDAEAFRALQQRKTELEQQLREALNKQHDAMTRALQLAQRNEDLENAMSRIDSFSGHHKKEVSVLQQKLDERVQEVRMLNVELTEERMRSQKLIGELKSCRLERDMIQHTLESALNEKKQMTDRINELTMIEGALNDEINRLSRENESHRQDNVELQYSNRMLQDESRSKRDASLPSTSRLDEVPSTERNNSRDGSKAAAYSDLLQQTIEQLNKEKEYYREAYNNLRDNRKMASDDSAELWIRVQELKCELAEKEKALDSSRREKEEILRKKNNLERIVQASRNNQGKCSVCERPGPCGCSSLSTKAMLDRLERERDTARADVERLIEECDALRERIKMSGEAHASEQRRLRENLSDLETRLKHVEKERQELLLTQGTKKATISGLEGQLEDVREELRRTKQELATQRTQYFQLRALQDQTDQALADVQGQLSQSEAELNKALDRNKTMERQQQQLGNQAKELKQEINGLRTSMGHLDHEKDQLLMALDEKTEKIAALEREILAKEQQAVGMQQQVRDLQHKQEICVNQSADQERHLRAMQLELENLQRQLETASFDRENAIQENRRLQDDLAAMTCEVRNLQHELETSREESYDLKRQLQTYVGEVRRAEELLNRKENERTEMLDHFRSLSLEATVLENNNHSLESEAAEARGALQTARDRLHDLERQLADKDSLITGYEAQISEMSQNIASMETQLRQQGEQRHRTEADLCAVRDLCVKLDQQKDSLMLQLNDKDDLKSQYDTQIARLRAEQSMIQDQMNRDRATVERLETLLDQARQESMNAQAANQELQNEMSRLKQKISELQTKLSTESAELRQYQNQAAEYSRQIGELRRQVTNERFDRARKEEETRRTIKSCQDKSTQDSKQICDPKCETTNLGTKMDTYRYAQKGEGQLPTAARPCKPETKDQSSKSNATENCVCPKGNDANGQKELDNEIRGVSIILHSSLKSTRCPECTRRGTDQTDEKVPPEQRRTDRKIVVDGLRAIPLGKLGDSTQGCDLSGRTGPEASTRRLEETKCQDRCREKERKDQFEILYKGSVDNLSRNPVKGGRSDRTTEIFSQTTAKQQSGRSDRRRVDKALQVRKNVKNEANKQTRSVVTETDCRNCDDERCKEFWRSIAVARRNLGPVDRFAKDFTRFDRGNYSTTQQETSMSTKGKLPSFCVCLGAPLASSSPRVSAETREEVEKTVVVRRLRHSCSCSCSCSVETKETGCCSNKNVSSGKNESNTVKCLDVYRIEPIRLNKEYDKTNESSLPRNKPRPCPNSSVGADILESSLRTPGKRRRENLSTQNQTTLTEFTEYTITCSDLTRPEFVRMLAEIKEHTKNLEEQLTIMNRSIKSKQKPVSAGCAVCNCDVGQARTGRDASTQHPPTRNMRI